MDIKDKVEQSGEKHLQKHFPKQVLPIRFQDIGIPRLLLMVAAGVVLLVLSFPGGDSGNSSGKKDASGFGSSSYAEYGDTENTSEIELYTEKKEVQLEKILSKVRGIGKVEVMITLDFEEEETEFHNNKQTRKVEGVLVVAQGAGEAKIDTEIIQAVQALFPLESHKIRVMKME